MNDMNSTMVAAVQAAKPPVRDAKWEDAYYGVHGNGRTAAIIVVFTRALSAFAKRPRVTIAASGLKFA